MAKFTTESHRYEVVDTDTGEVLDSDAAPTMFMLADWPGRKGPAVRRFSETGKPLWNAANYPGFKVEPGERIYNVKIRTVIETKEYDL